jgi:molybdopterin synthase sulfur carrier subunit
MAITIKLFASYRELLGRSELTVDAEAGATVADLFEQILGGKADQALLKATMFAVNEEYVSAETKVSDGDRVAFLPPVSGG